MKDLIILLLLGVIGWFIWREFRPDEKTEPLPQPALVQEQAAPSPTPVSAPDCPVIVHKADLVILRGTILSQQQGVTIVSCEPDPTPAGFGWQVDAGTGAAGIQQLAKLAVQESQRRILEEFGPLKTIQHGKLTDARIEPENRPLGQFALVGFPQQSHRLHVIAAPTGQQADGLPVYTTDFVIQGEARTFATPRSIYPPGVDTPEERRAYLQSLVDAKKAAQQQPSTSTPPR